MLNKLKNILIGSPLPTFELSEKRLNKVRALAAFSPDALSSIAYANQEIYQGLLIAGAAGLILSFPIALAISLLLVIVTISYSQTISGYPSGGGSYIVARENLGTLPGLVAAAALMIDYVLTAAVSLTAGVAAITSALPELSPYRVWIALGLLLILTLLNMRGLQETGTFMSVPVYLFLAAYMSMIIFGGIHLFIYGPIPLSVAAPPPTQPLTLILALHAFSAGCTALTGIESISNGVPSFKSPSSQNARKTLAIMAVLMSFLFIGSMGLTQYMGVIAMPGETILSALAHQLFGSTAAYFGIQVVTLLILAVAANTSFAGFPRVAAILANDRFLPRQMNALGDRLVFNNGIIVLAAATAGLIILFNGDTHALIPLFAIGAFMAFTLSQTGMVFHWIRSKEKNRKTKAFFNGLGAVTTAATLIIIAVNKFLEGAWISVLVIPILIIGFYSVRVHYRRVSAQLSLHGLPPSLKPFPPQRIVIPVSGIHRGIMDATNFARSISEQVTAVYVELEPGEGEVIRKDWESWWPDVPLVILPSPFRSIVDPILKFLDETDREHNDGQQAVLVLPEFIPAHSWQSALHNQSAILIKKALLYRRRQSGFQRVIIDVPFHLNK